MKRQVIWQCWLVSVVTSLILFIAFTSIFYGVHITSLKQSLVGEMTVYKELLDNDFQSTIDAFEQVKNWQTRLSIFDKSGNAIFESDTNIDGLDNHLDRPEIQSALAGKPQFVERYSKTFGINLIYYAEMTADKEYIVRIAMPMSSVNQILGTTIPLGIVVLVLALVVSYLLAVHSGKRVAKQIVDIRDSLHSLNDGKYQPIDTNMKDTENYQVLTEIDQLFETINQNYNQLQLQRAQIDFVLNNISQGVIAFDKDCKSQFVNKSACDMLGKCGVGVHYMVLLDSAEQCEFFQKAKDSATTQKAQFELNGKHIQFTFVHTSGELSQHIAYLLVLSDITSETEWIKQKDRFFSNASHELKTPLTSIQGLSEMLMQQTDANSTTAKYLKRINTESVRMNNLVMDMLYIDKLDSQSALNEQEKVHLTDIVKDVLAEQETRLTQKNITVNTTGNAVVLGQYRDMYELVSNIVGNAVNYNKQDGTIDIAITEQNDSVTLSVADSGIGIDSKHLPRICERFYRVDKSRSKETGGTGLGLSIVKHICLKYNAMLNIQSEVNKGTTVTVTFNLK